nr:NTP transferase domain-containing protein [Sphingomonas quercus]
MLVCAGLSERFGAEDKMMAELEGQPLALHAAAVLAAVPLDERIAVLRPGQEELAARLTSLGFRIAINPRPADGRDSSIRIGLTTVSAASRGALLCLGDMPRITPALLGTLVGHDPRPALCVHDGIASPPAWFPRRLIAAILDGREDPIRAIVARAGPAQIPADAIALADVDTPADLGHVRQHGTSGC